jgi:D-alanyl-D-alanine carboxypeptidase
MFERFTGEARAVVKGADREARCLGSPTIEAEHLLLALAADGRVPGLEHDDVLAALDAQRERSLRAIGISADAFDLPPAPAVSPRFAASAKLALARAVKAADRRIGANEVLLGVLDAEAGTVPRALEAAGVDAADLRAQVTDC